ncbi:MAG: sugar transferase [Candidatus Coproplasma sp.]
MEIENIDKEIDMQTKEYQTDGTAAIDVATEAVEQTEEREQTENKVIEIKAAEEEKKPRKRSGFRYGAYLFVKRTFDIVSSGIMFIILSLPILICMLIKWMEDICHPMYELVIEEADADSKCPKGVTRLSNKEGKVLDCYLKPVKKEKDKSRFHNPIYTSRRVGKNGKIIKFFKIRSMCPNAETMKQQLIDAGLNEADEPAFKIAKDPRITKFGKFLRKTSIDELPQLLNIFKGDMSVVGPRPPIPSEVEQYTEYQKHRLDVKGGLLCLWQIQKDRNKLSFDEWVKLDLEYIEKQSCWLDLKIIIKGAYMVIFDHSGE